jgi:hypothetical protein
VLSREVGDTVIDAVMLAVGVRVEGGVPVGNGVMVTDLVAGFVGVLVAVLCGERVTLGVLVTVAVAVVLGVEVIEVEDVGVILDVGVVVIVGVTEGAI